MSVGMSVEQLLFSSANREIKMSVKKDDFQDTVKIEMYAPDCWVDLSLDRNQADLLRLWLEEHLK